MSSNPARRQRRAVRFGHRAATRMTEYQRNRQAGQPRGEVKVHAHLHGLDLNTAAELDEAGAFEGLPCEVCEAAIEWSGDLDAWQHHATKRVRCAGDRGKATPPDWYAGDPVLDEAFDDLAADDGLAEDLGEVYGDQLDDVIEAHAEAEAEPEPEEPPAPRRRGRLVDGNPYDTEFARGVMAGLQNKPVYQGTVAADEVERRRLRNRDANRARRALLPADPAERRSAPHDARRGRTHRGRFATRGRRRGDSTPRRHAAAPAWPRGGRTSRRRSSGEPDTSAWWRPQHAAPARTSTPAGSSCETRYDLEKN